MKGLSKTGSLTGDQIDDSCVLLCAAERIKSCRYERVSISWLFGPEGLGSYFARAKQGERSAQVVADVVETFLKEERA